VPEAGHEKVSRKTTRIAHVRRDCGNVSEERFAVDSPPEALTEEIKNSGNYVRDRAFGVEPEWPDAAAEAPSVVIEVRDKSSSGDRRAVRRRCPGEACEEYLPWGITNRPKGRIRPIDEPLIRDDPLSIEASVSVAQRLWTGTVLARQCS
jgi:hypothetical protein